MFFIELFHFFLQTFQAIKKQKTIMIVIVNH